MPPSAATFLALVLQKELADRCRAVGVTVQWPDLLRDLDRLQEATIAKDGKRITTRTPVTGRSAAFSRPPASPFLPTPATIRPNPRLPQDVVLTTGEAGASLCD
jgi:hypothetical protein